MKLITEAHDKDWNPEEPQCWCCKERHAVVVCVASDSENYAVCICRACLVRALAMIDGAGA